MFSESFGAAFARNFAERFACAIHLRANVFDFFCKTLQLGVATFDFPHSFRRALAKRDHFGDRAAIFALQSFKERNALLQCGELLWIEIKFFGVSGKRARDLGKLDHAAACADENCAIELSIFSSSRSSRCVSAS